MTVKAERNGTWWKIGLTAVGMIMTVLLTVWGVSMTRAEDRGVSAEKIKTLEKACEFRVTVDQAQDIKIDHVETRVGVLEQNRAVLDTNQKNIMKQLENQDKKLDQIIGTLNNYAD